MSNYRDLYIDKIKLITYLEKYKTLGFNLCKKKEFLSFTKNEQPFINIYFKDNSKTTFCAIGKDITVAKDFIANIIKNTEKGKPKNLQIKFKISDSILNNLIMELTEFHSDKKEKLDQIQYNFTKIEKTEYYEESFNISITHYKNKNVLIQGSQNPFFIDVIKKILEQDVDYQNSSIEHFISIEQVEQFQVKKVEFICPVQEIDFIFNYYNSAKQIRYFIDFINIEVQDFSFILFYLFKLIESSIKYLLGKKDFIVNTTTDFGHYFDKNTNQLNIQYSTYFNNEHLQFINNIYSFYADNRNKLFHGNARKNDNYNCNKQDAMRIFDAVIKYFEK